MAASMTYTSLLADLRRYLERGQVNDPEVYQQLPRLVNLAERAIINQLRIIGFINVVTSTLVAGTSVYAKPDRWRQTVSMEYGAGTSQNDRTALMPRSYEYMRKYWPNSDTRQAPEFYCDYNYTHWLVAPTPDANYPWQIIYYQQPPYLDDSNQTNWLTDFAPNCLLYRALLEAAPFLKADERIGTWEGLWTKEMSALDQMDLSKIVDRAVTRQED